MSNNTYTDRSGLYPQKYYCRAFATELAPMWRNTDYAGQIDNLCFYRGIEAFLEDGETDYEARKRLLRCYLLGEFSAKKDTALINRMYHNLPTSAHLFAKFRMDACVAYNVAPNRKWNDGKGDEDFEEIYERYDLDAVEQRAYERAKFVKRVGLRPYLMDDQLQFMMLMPSQFRVKVDPSNPQKVTEVAYMVAALADVEAHANAVITVWREDVYFDLDADGRVLGEPKPNPYGIIPFAFLSFTEPTAADPYGGGKFDLLEAQLESNRMRFLTKANVGFNGAPVKMAINMGLKTNQIDLGLGEVVDLNDVKGGANMPQLPPGFDILTSDPNYDSINQLRKDNDRETLRYEGIPDSQLSESGGNPPNGISRKLDRQELTDMRGKDRPYIQAFSRDLKTVIATVWNNDTASGVTLDPEAAYSLDLDDEPVYMEPKDDYELAWQQLEDGVTSAAYFGRVYMGLEGAVTDEEALIELKRRRDLLKKYEIKRGGVMPGQQPPPSGAPPSGANGKAVAVADAKPDAADETATSTLDVMEGKKGPADAL